MDSITIIQPDDFHLHLRDEEMLNSVVHDSARQFARAIVMPNLKPPVTTVELATAYRQRILSCLPEDTGFQPLMTLYLTDRTRTEDIDDIVNSEFVHAVKYYPAGATTNSEFGVTDLKNVYPILEKIEHAGVPLLIHGEVTDANVDPFDREKVFIETVLAPLLEKFQGLKVVFEHITTREAVEFVTNGPDTLAATVTPQHLMFNRGALFKNGLHPHHYCLPILKREEHREAIANAATSGNAKFFLGTDSAPHAKGSKESDCGCAGIYSAMSALEIYTQIFEDQGCLDKLEQFASINGAKFYGLPVNTRQVTLVKQTWDIPKTLPFGYNEVVPLLAGESLSWKLQTV
jgi:dihydroorotase